MVHLLKVLCEGKKKILFTFPYAGGSSTFIYKYLPALKNEFDIYSLEYPGRSCLPTSVSKNISFHELCIDIVNKMMTLSINDYEIYFAGVSMGGYVAFKVAQLMEICMKLKINKVVLFSVNSEQALLRTLCPPWPDHLLKEYENNIDPSLYLYLKELMLHDGNIMRTMNIGDASLMSSELIIANAANDLMCHSQESISYWQGKSIHAYSYHSFGGTHIPQPHDFSRFILP